MRHLIAIDRGGTFTDAIHWDRTTGEQRVTKLLSSPDSPILAIRRLLELGPDEPIPPVEVRLGTTLSTNALLERRGWPTGLLITRGFKDLLRIGTQARPQLFELDIQRQAPLYSAVEEIDARISPRGEVLLRPRQEQADAAFLRMRAVGITSVAIVVLHAYKNPELEMLLGSWAQAHFASVVLSHVASHEEGLLSRASTTVLEAFLGPTLAEQLRALSDQLPGSQLLVMQSSAGLSLPEALRGPAALLSGPAGGVVAAERIAGELGATRLITLDMGGTSTDVSVVPGGGDLVLESEMAGITVRAPMVDVRTVAAGGSSVCAFDGHVLTVGPRSVGADPGPLCFGRPEATELSLTDVDLLLGRLVPNAFPIVLDAGAARRGAGRVLQAVLSKGHDLSEQELLLGFRKVAAARMAEAIRQVTIERGFDPRESPLLVFGGAAGQHACAVAKALGVSRVVVHHRSSVLSALGIGLSDEIAIESADASRREVTALAGADLEGRYHELEQLAARRLRAAPGAVDIVYERSVLLGYRGTLSSLPVALAASHTMLADFERLHARRFGFLRHGSKVEAQSLRVVARRVTAKAGPSVHAAPQTRDRADEPTSTLVILDDGSQARVPLIRLPLPEGGPMVRGPALLIDETSTIWLEPEHTAQRCGDLLLIDADAPSQPSASAATEPAGPGAATALDPARLEVMSARFMSIAEQMGRALSRSAQSTNIRERLDFSCALFDGACRLIANAPHIPVHLGAMGESVRAAMRAFPALGPGQVVLTNDPHAGGSHLPDITVMTPVFSPGSDRPAYFVACRGHHADVGGKTPGSMPPHAASLSEEGVLLPPLLAVEAGQFLEGPLRQALSAGPWPARDIEQNLGDLRAQVAANHLGAELLLALEAEVGADVVRADMQHLLSVSAARVGEAIARLPKGNHQSRLEMDDGTALCVSLRVEHEPSRLVIDFSGTSAEVDTNFNAPRAVTQAAVLYFLRTLSSDRLPLTDGCLEPVTVIVPPGTILDPSPGRAVSAGNVETSMQLCDLLFLAIRRCAASQGTMNNLTFGDETFGYYETIAGGAGAGPGFIGESGVHTHMTNTRITDPEVLENRFPVRVWTFQLRPGSGGDGLHRGGDGTVRELEALVPLSGSIVSERRRHGAPGLSGGQPGLPGRNTLDGHDLGGKASFDWRPGSRLRIETPGGGGYGVAAAVGSADPAPTGEGEAS